MIGSGEDKDAGLLFSPGRDTDFEGLRINDPDVEGERARVGGGRVIRVEEFYASVEQENVDVYDRDFGESSEDE